MAFQEMYFLRGGFFMDVQDSDITDPISPDDDSLDRFNEFRFGAGIKVMNLAIDYAWQDIENLESVHRIAASYAF
jgi:hypothetical protein